MFHIASKVLFFLSQPSNLAVFLIAAGLVIHRFRPSAARWLIAGGFGWIAIAGFLPLGNALILPLEERFGKHQPVLPAAGSVTGIIVLGGFEDGWVTSGRGGLAVNEAAERLTEAVRIARLLPNTKIVFAGGVGELFGGLDAGTAVRQYFLDAGIPPERIIIENASRDTYENAIFTRRMLNPTPQDHWLLVTSAYHMPRSVGVFRQAGFNINPFPVDFRTRDVGDLLRPPGSVAAGLQRADLAVKEWIGLIAYRIAGRSSALFPAP
jgi:uncharacterized SAM-binding protein YcdF (DUF218 family)